MGTTPTRTTVRRRLTPRALYHGVGIDGSLIPVFADVSSRAMSIDELEAIGLRRMGEAAIDGFLKTQGVGVLGLPTEGAPYLLPLSFAFDGDRLLFAYLLGEHSEKERLTERAEQARFLAFDVRATYTWESVLLTGRLSPVPADERAAAAESMENAWRPEVFEEVELSRGVALYEFAIEERSGIKHVGLPPALQRDDLREDGD